MCSKVTLATVFILKRNTNHRGYKLDLRERVLPMHATLKTRGGGGCGMEASRRNFVADPVVPTLLATPTKPSILILLAFHPLRIPNNSPHIRLRLCPRCRLQVFNGLQAHNRGSRLGISQHGPVSLKRVRRNLGEDNQAGDHFTRV